MRTRPTEQTAAGRVGAGCLVAGAHLGGFTVHRVATGRLTLRGSRAFATKSIALGVVLLAFGLCAWASVLRHDPAAPHGKVLVFPLLGVIGIVLGLTRLGETWEFDASSRVLVIFGFLGHKVLRPGFFNRVRLTALPTNLKQRETLVLDLVVSDRVRYPVGRRRTNKPDAANLIVAARQIAAMLALPLEVVGTLELAPPSILQEFADLADTVVSPLGRAA